MRWLIIITLASWLPPAAQAGEPFGADGGVEFYEKKIRPLLLEHCAGCHGPKKQRGGLRVDGLAWLRKGGDRGAAMVPKDPAGSLLLRAVGYEDNELRMPPTGKLRDDQIADLRNWIAGGAPGPAEAVVEAEARKDFDLAERRQHWCHQPLCVAPLPAVADADWAANPIDFFLLARMEQAGLSPAPPADKRAWLRRATLSLVGLPPTASELDDFLADDSPRAHERVVDRLLSSPRYGERWARHWLDLVRYAETLGHEFDYDVPNAWRYRDYVIRALNADLPYDRFVVEHLAGDLLPEPRCHPTEGFNESIIGTGFWWFGEGKHGPVDVRMEQAERIDNQIDVFGKTFLAQTIACARCHDHKFDAFATADYYALFGLLKSSRYQQAFLEDPASYQEPLAAVRQVRAALREVAIERTQAAAKSLAEYLLASREVLQVQNPSPERVAAAAQARGLLPEQLGRWIKLLTSDEVRRPSHPLFAWGSMIEAANLDGGFAPQRDAALRRLQQAHEEYESRIASFPPMEKPVGPTWQAWMSTGQAFVNALSQGGEFVPSDTGSPGRGRFLPGGMIHSALVSNRLQGVMRSLTFTLQHRYLHFHAAGRGTRINLVIDGFTIIRDPIYGGLTFDLNDDRMAWRTMDVGSWRGHQAYVELQDDAVPHPSMNELKGGYLAINAVRASDMPGPPPEPPHPLNHTVLTAERVDSMETLAAAYAGFLSDGVTAEGAELANVLLAHDLLPNDDAGRERTNKAAEALRQAEARLPTPLRAPALADGTGEDEHVFLRGNYKTLGQLVPRGLPAVFGGEGQPPQAKGSGRLAMAEKLVAANQAQLARVIVNRLWHHHFGRGIVATTDDFGRMGSLPTHPELLDYLANEFIQHGWSLKHVHRLIVLSSGYRQSSRASPETTSADPDNLLWSRFPVRRLEAETIRDAILATSGRLDLTPFGPGVMPYLTPFMEGRGRPGASGPLDGHGRRSIYLAVRRNFLNPTFLAFDYPTPFTTIGKRSVSNVPAQALAMLNDPFVLEQARFWAERATRAEANEELRLRGLYRAAFGREPDEEELADARQFLADHARRLGKPSHDLAVWADLCHVLFNAKEFIYVR